MLRLIPGDTISAMIGTQYKLTEAQAASLREYYGLDKPLHEQYLRWLLAALHGDLGFSVRSGQPVLAEILSRFPLTLELALLSVLIALVVGDADRHPVGGQARFVRGHARGGSSR